TTGPATDPDRDIGARRVRFDDEIADLEVRTVVLGHPASPDGADGADRVVGALAAPLERSADRVELLAQRPDADAEHEPVVAHAVELAVALRQLERVVIREHEHPRHEPDRRRAGGEEAEGGERVPVRGAAPADLALGNADVLRTRAEVESQTIGSRDDRG